MTARLPDTHLQAALHYAAMGWPVFPAHSVVDGRCTCGSVCESPGKHPRAQQAPNGFKNATRTLSVVSKWAGVWEQSNIAIRTGSESGIFVVDVNPRNGGQEQFDTLVARHGPLPTTLTTGTEGGGRRYVLKQPPGFRRARKTLGDGIDILSDGDFFIVQPFATSGPYSWLNYDMPKASDIADAPPWLLALASGQVPAPTAANDNRQNSQGQTVTPGAAPEPEPTPATPPADGAAIINKAEPVEVVVTDTAPAVVDNRQIPIDIFAQLDNVICPVTNGDTSDIITVVIDEQHLLGKNFTLMPDGKISKKAAVAIARGVACQYYVPDLGALEDVLRIVSDNPHAAILNTGWKHVAIGRAICIFVQEITGRHRPG